MSTVHLVAPVAPSPHLFHRHQFHRYSLWAPLFTVSPFAPSYSLVTLQRPSYHFRPPSLPSYTVVPVAPVSARLPQWHPIISILFHCVSGWLLTPVAPVLPVLLSSPVSPLAHLIHLYRGSCVAPCSTSCSIQFRSRSLPATFFTSSTSCSTTPFYFHLLPCKRPSNSVVPCQYPFAPVVTLSPFAPVILIPNLRPWSACLPLWHHHFHLFHWFTAAPVAPVRT